MRWHEKDPNGTVISGTPGIAGVSSTQLNSPVGITVDQWQNIYVSERMNNRVQLFCNGSSTGITIAGWGTAGASLLAPFDVKLDSQMNMYVVEYTGHRVMKFLKL